MILLKKLTELKHKILDVSGLATKSALNAVENKIPNASTLVKKQTMTQKSVSLKKKLNDHNHDKYITTPEFNTLAAVFNARLAQANLITKTDFDATLSNHIYLVENELKKLKTFDSSYFIDKSRFEDGAQIYLVLQPMYRYFKMICGVGNGSYIYYRKSEGLSDEKINSIKTPNHSIHNIPPKIRTGGDLIFKIWTKREVMKKWLRNREVS